MNASKGGKRTRKGKDMAFQCDVTSVSFEEDPNSIRSKSQSMRSILFTHEANDAAFMPGDGIHRQASLAHPHPFVARFPLTLTLIP